MRGEWLRQCLKTFLFSGCVPFHNNGGCGVEEAMSLDQILKSVLWSLRRLIHPSLPTQTKLKFFPAEEMSHGLGITRNFILMLCIKIASRFWNDYNEFVCSVKSGEKICLGSIYSVWSLSWRPPPSPPNSPRCWKMLGQCCLSEVVKTGEAGFFPYVVGLRSACPTCFNFRQPTVFP